MEDGAGPGPMGWVLPCPRSTGPREPQLSLPHGALAVRRGTIEENLVCLGAQLSL